MPEGPCRDTSVPSPQAGRGTEHTAVVGRGSTPPRAQEGKTKAPWTLGSSFIRGNTALHWACRAQGAKARGLLTRNLSLPLEFSELLEKEKIPRKEWAHGQPGPESVPGGACGTHRPSRRPRGWTQLEPGKWKGNNTKEATQPVRLWGGVARGASTRPPTPHGSGLTLRAPLPSTSRPLLLPGACTAAGWAQTGPPVPQASPLPPPPSLNAPLLPKLFREQAPPRASHTCHLAGRPEV